MRGWEHSREREPERPRTPPRRRCLRLGMGVRPRPRRPRPRPKRRRPSGTIRRLAGGPGPPRPGGNRGGVHREGALGAGCSHEGIGRGRSWRNRRRKVGGARPRAGRRRHDTAPRLERERVGVPEASRLRTMGEEGGERPGRVGRGHQLQGRGGPSGLAEAGMAGGDCSCVKSFHWGLCCVLPVSPDCPVLLEVRRGLEE